MKTTDLKTKGSLNPLSISIFLIFSVIFVMLFALGVINIFVFIISMAFSVLLSNSIHIADQWERAVVLRMGKYSGLKGPGLFMIIPIIDRVSTYIDQRVRVSRHCSYCGRCGGYCWCCYFRYQEKEIAVLLIF